MMRKKQEQEEDMCNRRPCHAGARTQGNWGLATAVAVPWVGIGAWQQMVIGF